MPAVFDSQVDEPLGPGWFFLFRPEAEAPRPSRERRFRRLRETPMDLEEEEFLLMLASED